MSEIPDISETADRSLYWKDFVEANKNNPEIIVSKLQLLENQAGIDNLTGLLNRRGLEIQKDSLMATAKRHGETVLLFFCDADDLKETNKKSFKAGDDLLIRITGALRKTFRRESDVIVRMGGDEFLVLTSIPTSTEDIPSHVEGLTGKLLQNLGEDQLSIGISMVESKEKFEEASNRADKRQIVDKNTHKLING